jgi:hypothetical protein
MVTMGIVTKRFFGKLELFMVFCIITFLLAQLTVTTPAVAQDEEEEREVPVLDGTIGEKEYEFQVSFGGDNFNLYWTLFGDNISIALSGKTDGWIAFGIEPTVLMKDSDIIFGWVNDDGEVGMLDCFSTGATGPHPPDIELGGTSDLNEFAGSEKDGWTSIEFKRELATGDSYDKVIKKEGKTKIMWALGSADDYNYKHIDRGGGIVDFSTGDVTESVPWYFHATWMTAGIILMLSGIIVIKFMKTKPWRIKVHKALLLLGGASSILGLISGIFMVTLSGSGHFKVFHAYLGLATIICILITIRFGLIMFTQPPEKIQQMKAIHRWSGRITATMMIINIFLGLSLVGFV